ncbi:hypothetical protein [Actinopolyspora lacussalsi]|uniref:hypothetical protein n=1 Tax=Actinopolyspora righensis TaxID=995060 RepID=UPI000B871B40|nr:hypothetical protein [Actinopolyspora righensis]
MRTDGTHKNTTLNGYAAAERSATLATEVNYPFRRRINHHGGCTMFSTRYCPARYLPSARGQQDGDRPQADP